MSRALLGVAVLFAACGSAGSSDAGVDAGFDAGPPPGTPGASVWFDSSARLQVSEHSSSSYPGFEWSRTECVTLTRDELSSDQSAYLESLKLVNLNDACTSDGYALTVLTVFEVDGGSMRYGDNGCSYLREPDAGALLPQGVFSNFQGTGTACQ